MTLGFGELVAASAVFAIVTGVPLGIFAAIRRRSAAAHVLGVVSLIGVSLPTFVIGIGLIMLAKHGRNVPIPFGPYLALGGIAALFFGPQMANFYLPA